jgi:hypothetical protein
VVSVPVSVCASGLYFCLKWHLQLSKEGSVCLSTQINHQRALIFIVGVLTQLSIVFGLFSTQAMGLRLATPTQWRLVLYISSCLAGAQLLVSPFMVESPAWLSGRNLHEEQKSSAGKLWGNNTVIPPDCKTFVRRTA